MADIVCKRGDDLTLLATVTTGGARRDLTGQDWRCSVRTPFGALVGQMIATIRDPRWGQVQLDAPATVTRAWPLGPLTADLEALSPDGRRASSRTFSIEVREDITL